MTIDRLPIWFFQAVAAVALICLGSPTRAAEDSRLKGSSVAQPIDDTNSVRVMTFNIRYNNPRDGKNAWPHRKEKVASMIRLHRADLAGLQEVQLDQLRELRNLLPEWSWAGVRSRSGKGKDDEHVPIIFRINRFELLDEGVFWLSETPEVEASKGWDAAITRICTWAKLRDRRTSKEFVLFNTHFDHIGEKARTESAKLMMSRVPTIAKDLPAIVIGDLNCIDTSQAYATLSGKNPSPTNQEEPSDESASSKATAEIGLSTTSSASKFTLHDAMHASLRPHHGPKSTFQGFEALPPDRRIDYVFITPKVQVLQHAILSDRWDLARWPSDHLPVLAEVKLD